MQEITSANSLTSMPALRLTAQGETAPLAQAQKALDALLKTDPSGSKPSLERAIIVCFGQMDGTGTNGQAAGNDLSMDDPGTALVAASKQLPPAQAQSFLQRLLACILDFFGFRSDGSPDLNVQTSYVTSIAETPDAAARYAASLRSMSDPCHLEPGSRFRELPSTTSSVTPAMTSELNKSAFP